jgi:non-specific serine/threonine protein kinase
LEGLAWSAAAVGLHKRAARLLGAALRRQELSRVLLTALVPFREAHDQAEKLARRGLGPAEYAVQHAIGAALPYQEIVAYALSDPAAAPEPAPQPDRGVLTGREYEIARLVATGKTSKTIAAELVISARTVDRHVQNILDKLEFRSRSQIAAWVTEQDANAS